MHGTLCVLAVPVASESTFGTGDHVINEFRSLLSPGMTTQVLFVPKIGNHCQLVDKLFEFDNFEETEVVRLADASCLTDGGK